MSKTLNLVDHVLHLGRNLHQHGQYKKAAGLLSRLGGMHDLPEDVSEEVQVRLAEIELERHEHQRARRHLAALLLSQPECAYYHYLLALATEQDPDCTPRQAGIHYRRAIELDPENTQFLCDYASYAFDQRQPRAAVTAWRRAADLAGDDADVLGLIAAGLRRVNKADEAKRLLRAALFRNPGERRFRSLWERHQFELLHAAQQPAPSKNERPEASPMILPFVRSKKRVQKQGKKTIRTDGPSELKGPTILPFHVARKKDA